LSPAQRLDFAPNDVERHRRQTVVRLSAECSLGIAAVRPNDQKTGGAVGWIVDWLKRAVPLATGAGTAGTTLALETVVPADHPLRLARGALDEALAATADEVAKAAGRLEGSSSPGELAALLLLATLYDAATADEVAELLRYDLAARWFVGWPNGPFDRPDGAIQEAMRRATGDPLVVTLQSRVLTAPAVAAGLGDRRWRVRPARLRAARRRGRWGEKRLRRQAGGGRLWRLARTTALVGGAATLLLVGYAALALPSAAEIRALLGRPTLAVEMGRPAVDRGRLVMPVPVRRSTLPDSFVAMLLTAEDRRFYRHPGFDPVGIGRAAWALAARWAGLGDAPVQGGSTLTQQLVKNALLSSEQSLRRKVDELLLAIKLELLFDKDELLELYLANAYFGAGVNGLELAARRYFGRRAPELAAHEAALLVSLLPSPESFRPDRHWPTARTRAIGLLQQTVLRHPALQAPLLEAERRLRATGDFADLPRGSSTFRPIQHRYFRDWALADVARHFPGATGEHRLVLTLDPLAQIYAQVTVERLIAHGRQAGFDEAAVVVMAPDGTVRAMVGGRQYATSQFSRATQARRQPGSAFKPIVYLAALEAGLDAASIVDDRPFRADGWPRNYRGGHQGKVTLEAALRQSLNGASVQVAEQVGRAQVIETARRLGLAGTLPDEPSLSLGVGEVTLLELVRAYAVFANGGLGVSPTGVLALRRTDGRTVAWAHRPKPERLVERRHAHSLNRLLRAVVAQGGSGNAANLNGHVAGKTGTTQHHRDAWFVGFTGDVVVGIWVGNDDRRPMAESVSGGTLPARAFANLLANLRDDVLDGRTTPPPGL
jgi:penicillin-binding protein 1A